MSPQAPCLRLVALMTLSLRFVQRKHQTQTLRRDAQCSIAVHCRGLRVRAPEVLPSFAAQVLQQVQAAASRTASVTKCAQCCTRLVTCTLEWRVECCRLLLDGADTCAVPVWAGSLEWRPTQPAFLWCGHNTLESVAAMRMMAAKNNF
eukprot:363104-Chlamydomonas_euryale.AAC.4